MWDSPMAMTEGQEPPPKRKLVEKGIMKIPPPVRDRKEFLRELKRAARSRLDRHSPEN